MTIYTINPDTWTKIGDGDCVVISEYRTELVYFRLDNGESVTSYLGKQLLVKNTGDLFAKSHSRTIEIKSDKAVYAESTKYPLEIEVTGNEIKPVEKAPDKKKPKVTKSKTKE